MDWVLLPNDAGEVFPLYAGSVGGLRRRLWWTVKDAQKTMTSFNLFLQHSILFTPKSAIPTFPQARPQKFLRPFLVCQITNPYWKFRGCTDSVVFPSCIYFRLMKTKACSKWVIRVYDWCDVLQLNWMQNIMFTQHSSIHSSIYPRIY